MIKILRQTGWILTWVGWLGCSPPLPSVHVVSPAVPELARTEVPEPVMRTEEGPSSELVPAALGQTDEEVREAWLADMKPRLFRVPSNSDGEDGSVPGAWSHAGSEWVFDAPLWINPANSERWFLAFPAQSALQAQARFSPSGEAPMTETALITVPSTGDQAGLIPLSNWFETEIQNRSGQFVVSVYGTVGEQKMGIRINLTIYGPLPPISPHVILESTEVGSAPSFFEAVVSGEGRAVITDTLSNPSADPIFFRVFAGEANPELSLYQRYQVVRYRAKDEIGLIRKEKFAVFHTVASINKVAVTVRAEDGAVTSIWTGEPRSSRGQLLSIPVRGTATVTWWAGRVLNRGSIYCRPREVEPIHLEWWETPFDAGAYRPKPRERVKRTVKNVSTMVDVGFWGNVSRQYGFYHGALPVSALQNPDYRGVGFGSTASLMHSIGHGTLSLDRLEGEAYGCRSFL